MKQELSSRLTEVKTIAMMEMREKMGAVELVNWWKNLIGNIQADTVFEDLDPETQSLVLKWEAVVREENQQ